MERPISVSQCNRYIKSLFEDKTGENYNKEGS